jgi:hypothetical protein
MITKKMKCFGLGLAVAVSLAANANASVVVYDWVNGTGGVGKTGYPASGTLTVSGGTVTDLTFTLNGGPYSNNHFSGTFAILGDNDLTLTGTTTTSGSIDDALPVTWAASGDTASFGENSATFGGHTTTTIYGDWVPVAAVPEPATWLAGILVLPFGWSTIRRFGKKLQTV